MIDSAQEGPGGQYNHGSGTFIGGDNYGLVRNEVLDPKTKASLANLSREAPGLANLLRKALRDGVISPDIIAALETAVRNINMDVADALMLAGRNINSDVAQWLRDAGQNINKDVVNKFFEVRDGLNDTVREFDRVLDSLREMAAEANIPQAESYSDYQFGSVGVGTAPVRVVARPSPSGADNWRFRAKLIAWSFAIGLVAGIILAAALVK